MKLIASPLEKKKEEGKKKKVSPPVNFAGRWTITYITFVLTEAALSHLKKGFSNNFMEGQCNTAAIKCNWCISPQLWDQVRCSWSSHRQQRKPTLALWQKEDKAKLFAISPGPYSHTVSYSYSAPVPVQGKNKRGKYNFPENGWLPTLWFFLLLAAFLRTSHPICFTPAALRCQKWY